MSYRITGLNAAPFVHLYGLTDTELQELGIQRIVADARPGYPDRIEMRDVEVGERLLLLNHVCQPANTPYRASHAIFIREGAVATYDRVGEIPEVMRHRLLSMRAYDEKGTMLDADVVEGRDCDALIRRFFENPDVAYIHAHNAKRGFYSGRIDRC
jgi:hypothetical protein